VAAPLLFGVDAVDELLAEGGVEALEPAGVVPIFELVLGVAVERADECGERVLAIHRHHESDARFLRLWNGATA
jgi:hypothetical protein